MKCTRYLLIVSLTLSAGCWWRVAPEDAVADSLARGEELYARRAEGEAVLREAIEALREAQAQSPLDPRVLAALARAYNALAWGYTPEESAQNYDIAREYALRCLATDAGYSSRVGAAAGRIDERAARRIGPELQPCLEQGLIAWLRWAELRGAASAVDLEQLSALARRARTLAGEGNRWVPLWSSAMVELLRPARMERDTAQADLWLSEAAAAQPELAVVALDRALHLALPGGDRDGFEELLATIPERYPERGHWALENRAAAKKASRALADSERLFELRW